MFHKLMTLFAGVATAALIAIPSAAKADGWRHRGYWRGGDHERGRWGWVDHERWEHRNRFYRPYYGYRWGWDRDDCRRRCTPYGCYYEAW